MESGRKKMIFHGKLSKSLLKNPVILLYGY